MDRKIDLQPRHNKALISSMLLDSDTTKHASEANQALISSMLLDSDTTKHAPEANQVPCSGSLTPTEKIKPHSSSRIHPHQSAMSDINVIEIESNESDESVDLIFGSDYFSPYNDIFDEWRKLEKKEKREEALARWEWANVIEIMSSDDDWEDNEFKTMEPDDSPLRSCKIPRVSVQGKQRVTKVQGPLFDD